MFVVVMYQVRGELSEEDITKALYEEGRLVPREFYTDIQRVEFIRPEA